MRFSKSFIKELYISTCKPDTEEVETLLVGLNLPTISSEQKEQLDAPITEEENRATILSMKTGRCKN